MSILHFEQWDKLVSLLQKIASGAAAEKSQYALNRVMPEGGHAQLMDRAMNNLTLNGEEVTLQVPDMIPGKARDFLVRVSLGEKGNFSARSFDGLIQVAIRQQYNIRLDERVIHARELMMEYVNSVLDRVDGVDVSALRLLVTEAFKVNSQGFLSAGRVLSLMRMEVNNDKWREAKMILQAALKPEKGKQYLICESRKTTQGDFKAIRLDIADCWPEVVK